MVNPCTPSWVASTRAVRVDHGAAAHPDALAEEGSGVAGRDEADVMAVGLFGDGQAAPRRFRTDLRLGGVTDRKGGVAQLICGQHRQHVGLILVRIDGAAQPPAGQPGVVAGGHGVEAQRQGPRGQRGELDSLIAPHAGVGGFPAGVGRHEIVDDVFG